MLQAVIDSRVKLGLINVKVSSISRRSLKWFDSLFATVIGISSLGAGLIFSIIFSGPAVPLNPTSEDEGKLKEDVRFLLSLSLFFFIAAIAQASTAAFLFNADGLRQWYLEGWDAISFWPNIIGTAASLGTQSLPTGAFLVASWTNSLYSPTIEWVALAFCGCFGFLMQFIVFRESLVSLYLFLREPLPENPTPLLL